MKISEELYNWLEKEFYRCNHSKYRKYFKEWIENITDSQIDGFYKQMLCQNDKSKTKL